METQNGRAGNRVPWNKGKLTGQKPPLKLPEIWAIRTRLQMSSNIRELAMFNLAIDSKLQACDLTRLQVQDVCQGARRIAGNGDAAEDATAGSVRDHRADSSEP